MALITQTTFLDRLRRFLRERARSDSLQALLASPAEVMPAWNALWPAVKDSSEHDAALFLTFWLVAQRLEGLDEPDIRRALGAIEGQAPYVMDGALEGPIKGFLEARGHVRFSDFDVPSEAGADAGPGQLGGANR